jgi:transcriptional regulator with XRE-family HTH domain
MSGIDLKKLAQDDPEIARGKAVVDLTNEVARLLRKMRLHRDLSQAEMADALRVSQARIAQLESGKPGNAPSVEQIAEYAFRCGRSFIISDAEFRAETEPAQGSLELARSIRDLNQSIQRLTTRLVESSSTVAGALPADARATLSEAAAAVGERLRAAVGNVAEVRGTSGGGQDISREIEDLAREIAGTFEKSLSGGQADERAGGGNEDALSGTTGSSARSRRPGSVSVSTRSSSTRKS